MLPSRHDGNEGSPAAWAAERHRRPPDSEGARRRQATRLRDCAGDPASSGDVLELGESSLYTALQRLLLNGWVSDEWGASDNNRRARYYTLTAAGRKHLTAQAREFDYVVTAIQRVLRTT